MPISGFKGRVLPEFTCLSLRDVPSIEFYEPPFHPDLPQGLRIKYKIKINDSAIDLVCDLSPDDDSLLSWVYNRVIGVVRALIDLYGFATGVPLSVILDRVVYKDGTEKKLLLDHPNVRNICSVMLTDPNNPGAFGYGDLLNTVIKEPEIFLALRDLISGISYPNSAAVDCGRAIDGLRLLFWPDTNDKKKGWELLRDNLRLSQDYVSFITKTSEQPRHGNRSYISGPVIEELTKRAWTIMNRFLEYRKRGNQPLPKSEFSLL